MWTENSRAVKKRTKNSPREKRVEGSGKKFREFREKDDGGVNPSCGKIKGEGEARIRGTS